MPTKKRTESAGKVLFSGFGCSFSEGILALSGFILGRRPRINPERARITSEKEHPNLEKRTFPADSVRFLVGIYKGEISSDTSFRNTSISDMLPSHTRIVKHPPT